MPRSSNERCRRVAPKSAKFDRNSYRSIHPGGDAGVRVLIACPRGKWDRRAERCKVGTRAVEVCKGGKSGAMGGSGGRHYRSVSAGRKHYRPGTGAKR